MQENTKTIVKKTANIVVNVILWLFVAFAVFITVIAVTASTGATKVPVIAGKCFLSVQSSSMDATKPESVSDEFPSGFKAGDFIVGKYIYGDTDKINELRVGDIITYEWEMDGKDGISKGEYNSHRIVKIYTDETTGNVVSFDTMGDNEEYSHGISENVSATAVIAVYTGKKANGFGSFITFLGTKKGFGLCILLPLAAFFVYQLIVFIITVIKVKNSDKKVITAADEEVIKQKAIEEYLRQQQAQAGTNANANADADVSATATETATFETTENNEEVSTATSDKDGE